MSLESKWATDEPFEPIPLKITQKNRRNRGKSSDNWEISGKDQPLKSKWANVKDEPVGKKSQTATKIQPLESKWADVDDEPLQKDKSKQKPRVTTVDKVVDNNNNNNNNNNNSSSNAIKSARKAAKDVNHNSGRRAVISNENHNNGRIGKSVNHNQSNEARDHKAKDNHNKANETRDHKPKDNHNKPSNDRREFRPNDRKQHHPENIIDNPTKSSSIRSNDRDQRKNHHNHTRGHQERARTTETNNGNDLDDEEEVKLTQAGVDFAKRLGINLQVDDPKWDRRNEGWGGKGRKDRGFNKQPEPKPRTNNKPKHNSHKPIQPKPTNQIIQQQSEDEKLKEQEARAFLESLDDNVDWAEYDD